MDQEKIYCDEVNGIMIAIYFHQKSVKIQMVFFLQTEISCLIKVRTEMLAL